MSYISQPSIWSYREEPPGLDRLATRSQRQSPPSEEFPLAPQGEHLMGNGCVQRGAIGLLKSQMARKEVPCRPGWQRPFRGACAIRDISEPEEVAETVR